MNAEAEVTGDVEMFQDSDEESIEAADLDPIVVVEDECRQAIREMLSASNTVPAPELQQSTTTSRILPTVSYSNKVIYKSTLVSELNGNPFLSKDRLTRIPNSVYFNNAKDYLSASSSTSTCLVGL